MASLKYAKQIIANVIEFPRSRATSLGNVALAA